MKGGKKEGGKKEMGKAFAAKWQGTSKEK